MVDRRKVAVVAGGAAGSFILLMLLARRAGASEPGTASLPGAPVPPGGGAPVPPGVGPGGLLGPGEGPPPVNPPDVVGPWLSPEPMPRSFYQIQQGDNPTSVARRVFGFNSGHPRTIDVRKCITSAPWNLTLYGTPCEPTQQDPCRDAVQVEGGEGFIVRKAFLPRHENAVAAMFNGVMPQRTIEEDVQATPVLPGSSYGLLWIPDMTYDAQADVVVCGDTSIPPAVAALLGFPQ